MAAFADLDLRAGSDLKALRGLVETAAHLGYSVVAINHIVDFKEKKREIEKPIAVSELFTTLPIVQRATSSRVRLYDIVAVFPKTEKLFHVACTHLDVDLVCITVTEKLPFYFKRPPVNVAIERGLGFELVYGPAIRDATMRRYTISNALNLMQICKGKNVILSSAAERVSCPSFVFVFVLSHILGGLWVEVLNDPIRGLLFGLSENDGKAAVSTNCRAVFLHGETRKTAFGIISTVKKPRPSEADDESLPVCKKAKCEG
ncbi:ribonuclease P/MRP 30 subunit (human), isoform CRA_b [Mus musculus]|nr:ribonuclease P/MRP 30 subunit (human), isoform CRA_b [Mus musculus]